MESQQDHISVETIHFGRVSVQAREERQKHVHRLSDEMGRFAAFLATRIVPRQAKRDNSFLQFP
jgi:hypothetical protein